MSEWKEYSFSDFVLLNPTVKLYKGQTHSFVEMKDLTDGLRYCESTQERKLGGGTRFQNNDTLFARITPCLENGKICQVRNLKNGKGFGSTEFHVFRGKKDISDTDFVFYLSRWDEVRAYAEINLHGTSGRQRVPKEAFNNLQLVLPPLPEQKAIAEVLSSLDDKIDLLRRQNKTLESMAETLFRKWFIEDAKEDLEITKIKDLDVVVTDYVANGSFASLAENVNYKDTPDYAILIRLTDYNNGFKNGFVYVDEHAYNFLSKSRLQGGEVIISNVGAYSGTVFKCPKLNKPMTLGPNSIVLKSEFNNFFYLYFKSDYGQFILDGIISGSAQPKFNKTSFRNIEIQYQSIEHITDFEYAVKPYFEKIEFNQNQIRTMEKLRDTLLPKLMSGEVRVKLRK